MVNRRMELRLSRAAVAAKVRTNGGSGERQQQLSVAAYAMYEHDKIDPSLKTIEQIAAALRVPPTWLAFGSGS
jgi:transcriptional regulator with XRE-family HTH domain